MMSPITIHKTVSNKTFSGLAIVCLAVASLCAAALVNAQEVVPTPAFSPPVPGDLNLQPVQEADIESELLTRGPVHEAYAEQYNDDPLPGFVIAKQPPELIEELPPEEMPDGNNVEWIPGYWAWEEDLDDYIWISGLWRDMPVGQRWVPGYWAEVDAGFRWVPGFWTSDDTEELTYLPEPPASLEQGPNVSAPTDNHFWVPGTWVYQTNNYAWQPGYWSPSYNDYVWMPSRYQYTPRGYIYCSGYWDYPVARRGVLFSPVYFRNRRIPYRYRGYRFQPQLVVTAGPLLVHLFVRPNYRHYYFGDYYAASYRTRGIYPFTQLNTYSRRGYAYDPLRTYYQVSSRRTTYNRLVDWNRYFDRNDAYRPPRTNKLTVQFATRNRNVGNSVVIQQATLGSSISLLSDRSRSDHRTFHKISMNDRNQISNQVSSAVREITSGRKQFEKLAAHGSDNGILGQNRTNPGQNLGNRADQDRDHRRDERASLKLPEVNQFRDRLSTLNSDQGNRSDRNFNGGLSGSINRDQRPSGTASDRGKSDHSRENSNRTSQRYTPTDLRDRIESARGIGKRGENFNPASRSRNEASSNGQRPTNSENDRLAEIRQRMEAAQKQQGANPASDRTRDAGRDARLRSTDTSRSTQENSDLRSRIEAARRAAESQKTPSGIQSRSPSGEPSRRTPQSGTGRSENPQGNSSNDLRARIEEARKAAEQNAKPSERQREGNRDSPQTNRSSERDRPTAKPPAKDSKSSTSSAADLRSRMEEARKSFESRSPSSDRSRNQSVPPTAKAANDIKARIESISRAREANQRESRTRAASSRDQRPGIEASKSVPSPKVESRKPSPPKATPPSSRPSAKPSERPTRSSAGDRSKKGNQK